MTLNNPKPRFQGHGYTIGALDVLCAQMTRDLFVIAEFLFWLVLVTIHLLTNFEVSS